MGVYPEPIESHNLSTKSDVNRFAVFKRGTLQYLKQEMIGKRYFSEI
jgi:hypothetical protein